MKKLAISIILCLTLGFTSCFNDDETQFFYELVPIESVEIPDRFVKGETVDITVSYFRPTQCHSFHNFNYLRSKNQRTVSVINVVLDGDASCEEPDPKDTVDINLPFQVGNETSYIFRFWQGLDEEGEDTFLEVEIPVEE